ncbi:MAG: 6,7-dimethyl-8-ribityllumazine synthase, partial [Calditrichaeota bacterium]
MAEVEEYHGSLNATGLKIAIVVARFNELVNQQLLQGALDCLTRHGVNEADIKVFWVPGAFEIPQVASVIAQRSHFDGMIAIGTVIRGATPHFEYVAGSAVTGISQVALQNNLPIT